MTVLRPVYLERLARCPGTEDRQGTADLAALETPEGVASFPAPLHFWAEETERNARWRPLRPGTLAGLADWSPEGTEERRAPCNAVYTALPQRACPHQSWASASGLPQKPSIGNDGPQTHVISKEDYEPESAQADPNETRLAGAPKLPVGLLREPASRDWPLVYLERLARCPGTEAGRGRTI